MTKDLFTKLQCALLHDMNVCESCKKCEGNDFAEIRINLIKQLEKELKDNDIIEDVAPETLIQGE